MKKSIGWIIAILLIVGIGGFIFYKFYLPDLVADALVTKRGLPPYVPKHIKIRVQKYKAPINKGAEDVIHTIHHAHISLEDVFKTIDETEEEQVYAVINELKTTPLKNTNQVFDIAKKHLHTEFDVEVLREPFNKNVDMKLIKKGMDYANAYRNDASISPDMAKAVIKRILLQKEKEFNQAMEH
jgi:hypothetical protein